MGHPVIPREPLKKTAGHKWAHITCAIWTPEIKFGRAESLEPIEGIPLIPPSRAAETCKVCKTNHGRCVPCHSCKASMHVECAHQAGYVLGFDITPVKGSRRAGTVTINGETGIMVAAIWCKEHAPTKTIVHPMYEVVDESGTTALQLYAKQFKQADLTQTGAMRKAAQVHIIPAADAIAAAPPVVVGNRRSSTIAATNAQKAAAAKAQELANETQHAKLSQQGPCAKCGIDVTPRWYPLHKSLPANMGQPNGAAEQTMTAAALNERAGVTKQPVQCHKCYRRSLKAKSEPSASPPSLAAVPAAPPAPPRPLPEPVLVQAAPPPPVALPPGAAPSAPIYLDGPVAYPDGLHRPPPSRPAPMDYGRDRLDRPPAPLPAANGYYTHRSPPRQQNVMHPGVPPPMNGPPPPRFGGPVMAHSPHMNSPHMGRPSPSAAPPPALLNSASPSRGGPQPIPPPPFRSPPRYHAPIPPPMHHQQAHYPPPHHPHPQQHSPYYSVTRPPPQHLTNGGPPPRAPEHPFQRPPMNEPEHRPSYPNIMRDDEHDRRGPPPPMPSPYDARDQWGRMDNRREERDRREPEWEPQWLRDQKEREERDRRDAAARGAEGPLPHGGHTHGPPGPPGPPGPQAVSTPVMNSSANPVQRASGTDHRVNGGASASPSLRNLLS